MLNRFIFVKKIFNIALLAVVAIVAALPVSAKALTATQVLDKVVTTVESAPSLALDLTSTVGNNSGIAKLVVDKERFRFAASDMNVYFDGSTQWTYQPSAREVTVTTPTASELAEVNPLAFVRNYRANYNVAMKSSAKGTYVVTMTAKKKGLYVKTAEVTVNASTWLPTSVKATLSNGQVMNVVVKSAVRGKKHPLDFFRFRKETVPGVEVIDLR